jgi:hypothetical protein
MDRTGGEQAWEFVEERSVIELCRASSLGMDKGPASAGPCRPDCAHGTRARGPSASRATGGGSAADSHDRPHATSTVSLRGHEWRVIIVDPGRAIAERCALRSLPDRRPR